MFEWCSIELVMRNKNIHKVIPFILLLFYYFVTGMFDVDFTTEMFILTISVLISVFFYYRHRKENDEKPSKGNKLILTLALVSVLLVLSYSYYFN